MSPEEMLKRPVAQRRGAGPREGRGSTHILVDAGPDTVLDALIAGGVIGAARRDCLAEVLAKKVPRPIGSWGAIVRLKGQPWTYVATWDGRYEWPREWAAKHGWRTALFAWGDGVTPTIARHYEGERCVFDFFAGLFSEPEAGFEFRKDANEFESFQVGGDDSEIASETWLNAIGSGEQAADVLARRIDAYLPLYLWASENDDDRTVAHVGGWEGDPHAGDNDGPVEDLPDDAFERVDVFTFGKPDTLEPDRVQIDLTKAIAAGDAAAAASALAEGANVELLADDSSTPLYNAMWPDRYKEGEGYEATYTAVSRREQLAMIQTLLDAGASLECGGEEYATLHAIERLEHVPELVAFEVLQLLLESKANPNARGKGLRTAGGTALHLLAYFHPKKLALAKLLIASGADVLAKDRKDRTPRQTAEERLAYLQKSSGDLTQLDPSDTSQQQSAADLAGGLAGALFSTGSKRKPAHARLMEAAQAEIRQQGAAEQQALVTLINLLASVENGTAERINVETLLEEVHLRDDAAEREKQKAKAEAEKKAQEMFGHWDLPPAERRQRSKELREKREREHQDAGD